MRKWDRSSRKPDGWVERRRRFRGMVAELSEKLEAGIAPRVEKVTVEKPPAE